MPEGYLSWQHLVFVTSLMVVMLASAWILGRKNRFRPESARNRVLMWTAFWIDGLELFKIVMLCIRSANPWQWLYNLPLFLTDTYEDDPLAWLATPVADPFFCGYSERPNS